MPLLTFPYPEPLEEGVLVRRYNRFLADIKRSDGSMIVAHCVNTGRMEGLVKEGSRVWFSRSNNPKRKLKYTWEISEIDGYLIGTNTSIPNQIVKRLLEERLLRGFTSWEEMKPEKKYGENSRTDFWLKEKKKEHYIEVKNCHLVYPDNRGYFPDSVSERASKHLLELAHVVSQGNKATVIFTAQRSHTKAVRPSELHDPFFAQTARKVAQEGVKFKALEIIPTPEALIVEKMIPVDLKEYNLKAPEKWKSDLSQYSGWKQIKRKG